MYRKIEDVIKTIGTVSDAMLNTAISKGALHLSDNEINTVSFVFWLCYLAERDLETVIKTSWEKVSIETSIEIVLEAKKQFNEHVFGKKVAVPFEECLKEVSKELADKIRASVKENYQEKRDVDIDNLPYFSDKITVYERLFSHNNVAIILWKINSIRNDVSHNRINELKYNGQNLSLRSTKEKILIDYMTAVGNPDHSKSALKEKLELEVTKSSFVK